MSSEHSNQANHEKEYIELSEVFTFILRARFWWITGAILLGVLGYCYASLRKPLIYVASVPYTLEMAPASDNYDISRRFNEALQSSDVVSKISDRILKSGVKPEMDVNTFSARQQAGGDQRLIPLKLTVRDTNLVYQWTTTSLNGFKEDARIYATEAAGVLREINKDKIDRLPKDDQLLDGVTTDPVLLKLMMMEALEEVQIRRELNAIRSRYKLDSFGKAQFSGGDTEGIDYLNDLALGLDRIPSGVRQEVTNQLTSSVGRLRAIRIKYAQAVNGLQSNIARMGSSLIARVEPPSDLLPILVVDPSLYGATEIKVNNVTPFFTALGLIVGGLMGVAGFVLTTWWITNRDKILKNI
jgi:hypothetical protein